MAPLKQRTKSNSFLTALAISATAMFAVSNQTAFAEDKPNIIIMMTDDQGYGDLGSHGNPYLKTPNIEKIGKNGIEMDNFVTYPNCSATRAGLLTGRYPYRTGVVAVTQVDHLMNASEITLAEVLKDSGYSTGIFGKWHLGDNYPMRPTDQGFEEALVHKAGGIGQAAGPVGNTYFDPILEHNDVSKKYEGYVDDIFTEAALDFIDEKKNDDEPFLLYLATNLPHFPLQVPDSRAQRFRDLGLHEDNALTFGMIENIDYNVGRVLKKVQKAGIEKDTIVIFMSDNGARNRRTKNDTYPGRWMANMRGTKTSVYDAGIRVPFFVSWPGVLDEGKVTKTMGTMLDIMPTLLDAANIEAPEGVKIDGQSLLPLWKKGTDETLNDREFIAQMHYGATPFKYMHFTVRGQKYKLVSGHDFPHGILTQPGDDELEDVLANLELYDLENDPSERINIAKDHPEIVEEFLAQYEDWFDEVTEERDSKGIQRIHLGTDRSRNVNLSRFDWGGPRVNSKNKLGHWRVKTEAGKYRISMDLDEVKNSGTAHLKYNDLHLKAPIRKGQKIVVFNDVELPADVGNLHAYIKTERLAEGPLFVDVARVK